MVTVTYEEWWEENGFTRANIYITRQENTCIPGVYTYRVNGDRTDYIAHEAEEYDGHYVLLWEENNGPFSGIPEIFGVICSHEKNLITTINTRLYQAAQQTAENESKRIRDFHTKPFIIDKTLDDAVAVEKTQEQTHD